MTRVAVSALLGIAAALALFAVACAPTPAPAEPTPVAATPMSGAMAPGAGTPGVLGAQATPGMAGTPSAAAIETLERDTEQFRDRLRRLAAGTPTPSDLMDMVQQASALADRLDRLILQMSMHERESALASASDTTGEMIRVMETHARQAGPVATPIETAGTPTPATMAATPAAAQPGRQLMAETDRLRQSLMRLAAGQVTESDVIDAMTEMQRIFSSMRQELGQISDQELESLTGNMAMAMEDLVDVMESHLRQEYGPAALTPGPMPGTPIPSSTALP